MQYDYRYRITNSYFLSGFSIMENINKVRTVHYSAFYGDAARFSVNQENMYCSYVRPYRKYKLSFCTGASVCRMKERSRPSIKNGLTIDLRNTDGGTVCGQTYYEICFGDAVAVSFEVEKGNVSRVQYGVPTKKNLERYTALIGRPALPPKWTVGLWLPASFPVPHDEYAVTQAVDGMSVRSVPLSVFHFDMSG